MKNLSKFTYLLFFLLLVINSYLFKRVVFAQAPSNTFNCEWTGIKCVVGNNFCSPGFGPRNQTCESITDIGVCQTTINKQCVQAAPGTKYDCRPAFGGCVPDQNGRYDNISDCQLACSAVTGTKFKCLNNQCVEDPTGKYSSPDCNGDCSPETTDPDPIPKPVVPCDPREIRDPEFDSLRPYQASACAKEGPEGFFCGNKVIIKEDKKEKKQFDGWNNCKDSLPVHWENVDKVPLGETEWKDYWFDITQTEFPIAGNTEQVRNSTTGVDKFDDPTKVNEYVSWYLNGVINRAEYGDEKNTNKELVDFSGPIQKLYPSQQLEALRIASTELASHEITGQDANGSPIGGSETHNQIVVCTRKDLLIIGKEHPVPCYEGSNLLKYKYRLVDIKGGLLGIGGSEGWYGGDLSAFNAIANRLGTDVWDKRTPPLPWDDGTGQPFASDILYRKAYNEWKGKQCTILPIFGLVCIDIPGITSNKWADLFPYVPLANTADSKDKMPIPTVVIQSSNVNIVAKDWNVPPHGEPVFHFAHAAETASLSGILNNTYLPKEISLIGQIDKKTTESNTIGAGECRSIQVRSNEGDNLFPIGYPGDIGVEAYFLVEELPLVNCENSYNDDEEEISIGTYYGLVTIEIHTEPVQVPFGEQTWNTTVAGPTSTVRRIFPKVEKGAPIECIADIPSETKASYEQIDVGNGLNNPIGVKSLQNPEQKFDPLDARIYFPHWGSIYDYFLKGIQTALRPKGYGEKIVNGYLCQPSDEVMPACSADISAVADAYKIPECQLRGVMEVETDMGATMGSDPCTTNKGNFTCCNGSVCGPAQIMCSQYDDFTGDEKLDMCEPNCASELLARAMLLKLCQAAGDCDTYDWSKVGEHVVDNYSVPNGDYTAACYFYGLPDGCHPTACSQYRWGAGKSYGDAVASYCGGPAIAEGPYPEFCTACAEEDPRVDCSQYNTP